MSDPTTLNRLYGRSKGKRLSGDQADLIESLLPQISIADSGELSSRSLFGDTRPMHFEIGFGGGEHLAYRADMLPDHGFIGCEPYLNGVAMALPQIREKALANVRLHMGDALEILRRVPDGSLSFVYLLHQARNHYSRSDRGFHLQNSCSVCHQRIALREASL